MAEEAIEKLVMDQQDKEMIKAIAKTYTEADASGRFTADFVNGKGEGQIILLHGPPGTGKTLTAGMLNRTNKGVERALTCLRVSGRIHKTPTAKHHSR